MPTLRTALIVEDEIFVALDLERILESEGYEVVGIAADRCEAMRFAGCCDIAFIDVNLRDGATGPEIARVLASDHGVRVVFVTANPAQIDGVAPTGATCVRKPFDERVIARAAAVAEIPGADAPGILRL